MTEVRKQKISKNISSLSEIIDAERNESSDITTHRQLKRLLQVELLAHKRTNLKRYWMSCF
jgi:hypothetical protein